MKLRGSTWPRRIAISIAIAAIGLVVLVLLGYWRLSSGAFSLDWLETRIEKAVNADLAPLSVELDGATLLWNGFKRPFSIGIAEVRIHEQDGSELACVAGSSVDLSPTALLRKEIALVHLEIEQVQISIRRNADGTFELGLGSDGRKTGGDATPLFESFLEPPRPGTALGELTQIGIHELDIRVEDRKLEVDWGAEDANLQIERSASGLKTRLSLDPILDRPLGAVTIDSNYSFSDPGVEADIAFDALELSPLSRLAPPMEILNAIEGSIQGRMKLKLSEQWEPQSLEFDLQGDPSALRGNLDLSAGFGSLTASVNLDNFEPWRLAGAMEELVAFDQLRVELGGHLELELKDGRLSRASVDLTGKPGEISLPDLYDSPLSLGPSHLEGSVESGLDTIRLDELSTTLGGSPVAVQIEADRQGGGYDGRLHADVDRLAVEKLATYWPRDAASGAREWVAENITEGEVQHLEFDMRALLPIAGQDRSLRIKSLEGRFGFDDLNVSALAPQPAITGIDGNATLSQRGLEFQVQSAKLGQIEITEARVEIGDLASEAIDLEIDLTCTSPVAAAIELMSGEPLAVLDDKRIAASDTSGTATANLTLSLPLSGESVGSGPDISVDATVTDFGWQQAPLDLVLSQGDLELSFEDEELKIQGPVDANGVSATVEYRADFGNGGEQWIRASSRISPEDAENLGLPKTSLLTGPLGVDVDYTAPAGQTPEISAVLDLRQSVLEIPIVEWTKPAGTAGNARVAASVDKKNHWSFSTIEVGAADLVFVGGAELDIDPFDLISLEVKQFDYSETKLSGKVTSESNGTYQIQVKGQHFEIDQVLKNLAKTGNLQRSVDAEASHPARLSLDIALQEISSAGEIILKNFTTKAEMIGTELSSLQAEAEAPGGQPVEARLDTQGRVKSGVVKAGDAGAVMKTLGLTSLFDGGELELQLQRTDASAPVDIHLDVTDLAMVESSVLGDILRLASLEGLLAALQGEGFDFKRVEIESHLGDGTLQIEKGLAYGQGIAITVKGSIDLKGETMSLVGMVAHTGPVQKAIGKIPGLGQIVLGRNKAGLLGTEFKLSGPVAEPKVDVNPISTFTPGILRDLFDLKDLGNH